ncbi:MAG: HEAT repeat domain-containing protein [Gemmatimonadota bacterium]|nr:HEAT repeat domain-containing protein [Gemmatimonadota bacterium]
MSYENWGFALVHFGWQGFMVAGLTFLALRSLTRSRAEVRYAVAVGSLVVMAVLPAITVWSLESRGGPADVMGMSAEGSTAAWSARQGPDGRTAIVHSTLPGGRAVSISSAEAAEGTDVAGASAAPAAPLRVLAPILAGIRPALGWIVGLWIVGVVVLSTRLLGGWVRLRRLTGIEAPPVPDAVRATAGRLAQRLGVSRPVRLVRSARVAVPAVVGWIRPVVFLPASALTGLTPAQLEAIIAHELAHIRRHDYLVNLFQSVVETLLYYHPAVWWVSRQIREEREHCCDDLAVAVCGGDRRFYAGALLDLEILRSPSSRLAVAADGGSLVSRVRRLLDPDSLEVEMFPRWTAALTAATIALFVGLGGQTTSAQTAGPSADATDVPAVDTPAAGVPATGTGPGATAGAGGPTAADIDSGSPAASSGEDGGPTATLPAEVAIDTLIVHPGGGSFEERLAWARETARTSGLGSYWVGYAVRPTPSLDGFIYSDRSRQVRAGSISMRGTIRGNISGLNPSGVDLAGRVGSLAPDDVAILLEMDAGGRLRAARVSSIAFRVDVGDAALVWIGSATASESVPFLARRHGEADDTWLAEDIVTAVGVHDDASVVVPVLVGWLEGNEADDVRQEAADWLGFQADRRSLGALVRATEQDPTVEVRREAAEALGRLRLPEATDALIGVARNAGDERVRREAVEALGDRTDDADRVLDELVSIARTDADDGVQREAIEAIGDTQSTRRVDALADVIRDHPDGRVQSEAIETLAEVADPDEAIRILRAEAVRASDESAARQAVESIGELDTNAAGPALLDIVNDHPSERVQREAVEAIASRHGAASADLLASVARGHPRAAVRREALEALAEVATADVAVPVLAAVARTDSEDAVRRDAIDELAEIGTPDAMRALANLMSQAPDERGRREAIERYAESAAGPDAAVALVEIVRTADSERIKEEALEALVEMEDDAGLEAVIELARSAPDRETRFMAIDALRDSDDPRAADALDRLIPG